MREARRAVGRSGATNIWASGDAYEPYVGRWSRVVAREFLAWLAVPLGGRWLDVGCGTGALSRIIPETASPSEVGGVDPSAGYIACDQAHTPDPHARAIEGTAQVLPVPSAACDSVLAGLVLNFVPDPAAALSEMRRAARRGGVVGAYVWDYAGGMEMRRRFWDAAAALDSTVRELDEGHRFNSVCRSEALTDLFGDAGLRKVEARGVEVPTVFRDFDDYWLPFLSGQCPDASHASALSVERRDALRERIRAELPVAADGSIPIAARAWAMRGKR